MEPVTVLGSQQLLYRAGAIWGHKRILNAFPRTDGGLELTMLRLGKSSPRGFDSSQHALDKQGAPICHPECREHALTVDW